MLICGLHDEPRHTDRDQRHHETDERKEPVQHDRVGLGDEAESDPQCGHDQAHPDRETEGPGFLLQDRSLLQKKWSPDATAPVDIPPPAVTVANGSTPGAFPVDCPP